MAKRVPVVDLGNMGMSHALAYTRIPGFEVVGVCERRVADRKLPPQWCNHAGEVANCRAGIKAGLPADARGCRVDFRVPL